MRVSLICHPRVNPRQARWGLQGIRGLAHDQEDIHHDSTTAHPEAPVVTETPVGPDLLQPLEVLTKLVVQDVGHHLGGVGSTMV